MDTTNIINRINAYIYTHNRIDEQVSMIFVDTKKLCKEHDAILNPPKKKDKKSGKDKTTD